MDFRTFLFYVAAGIGSWMSIHSMGASGVQGLAEVQAIFTQSCALAGCHAGALPAEGLNLEPGRSYENIVNVRSSGFPLWWRVKPGAPDSSLIYVKVSDICAVPTTCPTGARMPLRRPPLDAQDIETIHAWILGGALAVEARNWTDVKAVYRN